VAEYYVSYGLTLAWDICGCFSFLQAPSAIRTVTPVFKSVLLGPECSPTTHHNWFLFNFNISLVLLAEGTCMDPFASLSPVKDTQFFMVSVYLDPDDSLGNSY
jgi:hypothetical protein